MVDGWRIDAAPTSRQGVMAAAYQLGYRLALICAGAGALYIAEFVSWRAAYFAMAALMVVGHARDASRPGRRQGARRGAGGRRARRSSASPKPIVAPLADLFPAQGRDRPRAILALVALYRLPDFVAGVMANPLYIDLGFSKVDIANVSKLYGVWIGMIGAFAGGLADVAQIGLRMTLLIGAILGAGSNLMFSWLRSSGSEAASSSSLAISVDNFAGSFAGTALIAYMSGLTGPGFAATQYALLELPLCAARQARRRRLGLHRAGLRLRDLLHDDGRRRHPGGAALPVSMALHDGGGGGGRKAETGNGLQPAAATPAR